MKIYPPQNENANYLMKSAFLQPECKRRAFEPHRTINNMVDTHREIEINRPPMQCA